MKKLLHLADVHYSKETQDLAIASLNTALEVGKREGIDAWIIAGDLFDRSIANTESAGLPRLVRTIQAMMEIAPVMSVTGTPSHDVPGCYRIFQEIRAAHPFYDLHPDHAEIVNGILFLGLPELGKEWLLSGTDGLSADEANERIIQEARKILLGLGAIRASHPDLPCVLVHHGMIAGATMQNGQLAAGSLSLGREDLAMVGADLIALGHVHLEQQIAGLPAYYPGPAYHTDWGHLGRCGCNLVTIDPTIIVAEAVSNRATVTRVDFPHAPRRKLVADWPHEIDLRDAKGFQTWLVLRAPKGEDCDSEKWLEQMIDDGALPGSRVTIELIPTETVRAAEITEQKHFRDKVRVYAEASGEEAPAESVLAKADSLEQAAEGAGAEAGAHLRIRKLRLRGATGIWKGLGLDEVTLDLDRYDAGLVALVGPNGAGKSTLLENMHPWPCLLTREGKLQDHFRLRDSARELWFVDERDGAEYRALMLVDGVNATGKAEYHLFRGDTPLTNGRREDYEAAIARLFGSLALFLRSAFVSQRATKNNPDLAEATKGEKKAIFRELAGLDYLQAAAESAKGKGAEIEAEVSRAEAVIMGQQQALQALPDLRAKLERATADLAKEETELARLETEGKKSAEEAKKLTEAQQRHAATERAIAEAVEAEKTASAEASKAKAETTSLATAMAGKDDAERELATYEQLREEERQESERSKQHAEQVARTQSECADALRAHRDHEAAVAKRHTETQTAMVHLEGDRRVVLAQIDRLIADIAVPEKACPQCGYIDPQRKTIREGWQTTLADAQEKAHSLAQDSEEKRRELLTIEEQSTEPPAKPVLPAFDNAPLLTLRGELLKIDAAKLKAILEKARDAGTRIEELSRVAADREAVAESAMARAEELRGQLDGTLAGRLAKAQEALEAARQQYIAVKEAAASLRSQADIHGQRIAGLEQQQAEIEEKQKAIAIQKAEAVEWAYLERACGADGIQALELDALGPGIAEVANRLLSAAYGSRFAVSFRTTRIAGRGSKVKQVEDFAVFIHDSERESEQDLSTLSGGENVWVKRALYDAFAIIRDRNTGLRFLTAFQDEADGALDPEARHAYFAMLRAAHAESGRRHTIVITHSPEAQEAIPQRIVMAELAGVAA
jgi:exonuclease SbcC